MINSILAKAPVYLLVYVRCFALLSTLPLFSMRSVSRIVKLALAGYMAFFIYRTIDFSIYAPYVQEDGVFSIEYFLLAVGEGLIGIILGFYITIIFGAFSTAGQFTAFQMGFSAASTYDSLAQVENPLMGQFFNFMAIYIFIQCQWFQRLFLGGLVTSYKSINALSVVSNNENFVKFMISGLTKLFSDALVISLPLMGTLLLISICTGLLSKAAPQMNLLSEGFPIMILVSFYLIATLLPYMCDFFINSFVKGFGFLEKLFLSVSGGV